MFRRPIHSSAGPSGSGVTVLKDGLRLPRPLRIFARSIARSGLAPGPDQRLPGQHAVAAGERTALFLHLVKAFVSLAQVSADALQTDRLLERAEAAEEEARIEQARAREERQAVKTRPARTPAPADGDASAAKGRPALIGRWTELPALALMAMGEMGLTYSAARITGVSPRLTGLLTAAVGIATIVAAQVAGVCIYQLGMGPDGREDPRRRRLADIAVGALAVVAGVALVLSISHLREAWLGPFLTSITTGTAVRFDLGFLPWLRVLGLALLAVATVVVYAAAPRGRRGVATRELLGLLGAWWNRLQLRRAERRAVRARNKKRALVDRLWSSLAALAPQFAMAEIEVDLTKRAQAQHGDYIVWLFDQYLLSSIARQARSLPDRIREWLRGRPATAPVPMPVFEPTAAAMPEWPAEILRISGAARRVLVRRGLLSAEDGTAPPSAIRPVA
jgi:hypothetical protein